MDHFTQQWTADEDGIKPPSLKSVAALPCEIWLFNGASFHSSRLHLHNVRSVYGDTTELNSTELNWPSWTAYSQVSRVFDYDVMTYKLSQLLFTLSSRVELSCVAIDTP